MGIWFWKAYFYNGQNELNPPSPRRVRVESHHRNAETGSTPGTTRVSCPKIVPQIDGLCDKTNTDHYMQPDADIDEYQPNSNPTIPRSAKYDLCHVLKPKCNDNYR